MHSSILSLTSIWFFGLIHAQTLVCVEIVEGERLSCNKLHARTISQCVRILTESLLLLRLLCSLLPAKFQFLLDFIHLLGFLFSVSFSSACDIFSISHLGLLPFRSCERVRERIFSFTKSKSKWREKRLSERERRDEKRCDFRS